MILDAQKAQLIERVTEFEKRVYLALRPIVPKEWLNIELTMPQLKIILLLFTDGPARVSTLASALGVSLSTTTGITERLVQHDLIVKESDPEDGRAVVCSLSEKGREMITCLLKLGESRVRSLLETVAPAKLEVICEAMEIILQAVSSTEQKIPTNA